MFLDGVLERFHNQTTRSERVEKERGRSIARDSQGNPRARTGSPNSLLFFITLLSLENISPGSRPLRNKWTYIPRSNRSLKSCQTSRFWGRPGNHSTTKLILYRRPCQRVQPFGSSVVSRRGPEGRRRILQPHGELHCCHGVFLSLLSLEDLYYLGQQLAGMINQHCIEDHEHQDSNISLKPHFEEGQILLIGEGDVRHVPRARVPVL